MRKTAETTLVAIALTMAACEKEENEPATLDEGPTLTATAVGKRGCYTWAMQETDGYESKYLNENGRLIFYELFMENHYSDDTMEKKHSKHMMEYRWIYEHTIIADSIIFNTDSTYAEGIIECHKDGQDNAVMTGNAVFEEFRRKNSFYPAKATFILDKGHENIVTIKAEMSGPETFMDAEIYRY